MRKLILQVQITVDAFIARIAGEQDWMTWEWDKNLEAFTSKLTKNVDQILLGRRLAENFIPYWEEAASKPDAEDYAKNFQQLPKLVFSHSIEPEIVKEKRWKNTRIVTGDMVQEVQSLKEATGGDMIVYGGANFISSLISKGLIDDYYFYINPVAISTGLPIFHRLEKDLELSLIESRGFDCGIVVNHYRNSI